jgi:uncharacterized protein (TIGR02246 family)
MPAMLAALAALAMAAAAAATEPSAATDVIAAVRKASDAYVAAFNAGDEAAIAEQWTLGAELFEGGSLIKGRDAIVSSLRQWRSVHPQATIKIDVTGMQPLAEGLARVQGTLAFTTRPGEPATVSRFDSLRVLDGGTWRLAESHVVPTSTAALSDLGWMLGTWQSADAGTGTTIDATYERILGGQAILGRTKIRRKDGSIVEAIDLINADQLTGQVRSWNLDSTGARAEGVFSSDGVSFERHLVGAPGDRALGSRAEWVQVLSPVGKDMLLWQSIERTLDGRPEPDAEPVHLRKIR